MKIVINGCFGGFSVSKAAAVFMAERGNKMAMAELAREGAWYGFGFQEHRSDPDLVAAVEELGKKASGSYAELKVVEIPDGVEYQIEEYDGTEYIAEKHRTWS